MCMRKLYFCYYMALLKPYCLLRRKGRREGEREEEWEGEWEG